MGAMGFYRRISAQCYVLAFITWTTWRHSRTAVADKQGPRELCFGLCAIILELAVKKSTLCHEVKTMLPMPL